MTEITIATIITILAIAGLIIGSTSHLVTITAITGLLITTSITGFIKKKTKLDEITIGIFTPCGVIIIMFMWISWFIFKKQIYIRDIVSYTFP